MTHKRCTGTNSCNKLKPLEDFYRNSGSKDGRRSMCKECELYLKRTQYRELSEEKLNSRHTKCRTYYQSNKELFSDYNKLQYEANKDVKKANALKWAKLHPEMKAAINAKYSRNNPALVAAKAAKYRNSKLQRTPTWVLNNPDELWLIQQFYIRAAELTALTGVKHHVDHIYPLQGNTVSGFHCWQNLQILTAVENTHKSNKMPVIKKDNK